MAKTSDLITNIRVILKDPGAKSYSDYELLKYLNDAVDFLSMELISQRDDTMINDAAFTDGMTLPDDFVEFAGQYPISLKKDVVSLNDTTITTIDVRYWSKYEPLVIGGNAAFRSMYNVPVCQLASIYARSRDNGGIPQDEKELATISNTIALIRQKKQAATQLPVEG